MTTAPASVSAPCPLDLDDSPLVAAYCEKTATSVKMAQRARETFPTGITHDARYIEPHGIYVTRADGGHKWDIDGNEYVDYSGGHGAMLLGHNHPAVVEAVREQLGKGIHYGASHELELEWAERIKNLIPCAESVRCNNSGTEATMLALRLARGYTGREKVLRFTGHFHGWHDYVAGGFLNHHDGSPPRGVPAGTAAAMLHAPANDLAATERILQESGDVAAIILEPTGSTWGQVPVRPDFVHGLRELADATETVLIFDEVICGFGRTGDTFGASRFGVTPDMMTTAKGLTSGTVPMGAVLASGDIYDTFMTGPEGAIEFFHGYTYSGHPLAAAAGCATLDVYTSEGLFERALSLEDTFADALHSLKGEPNVIDIRNLGLIGAVELAPIDGQPTARAMSIFRECFDKGVIIRTTGDTLAFSPPLIIDKTQIAIVVDAVRSALHNQ